MTRSPETPLILWICAAICAHFMFAETGDEVATIHDGRKFMYELSTEARGLLAPPVQTIEISTSDEGKPREEEPPEAPKPQPTAEKKPEAPKPAPPKEEAKKPPPKKPDEVKVVVKKDDPLKKLDEQPLKDDQRIAVRQHVQDKQEDNPTAKFIGDQANHV
jgi:outer membrane biosynthesis protein TonB